MIQSAHRTGNDWVVNSQSRKFSKMGFDSFAGRVNRLLLQS